MTSDLKLNTTEDKTPTTYDMVINIGSDVLIGIDIKIKGATTLTHEQISEGIEKTMLKAFPDTAVKIAHHAQLPEPVLKPASKANIEAQRRLKASSTTEPQIQAPSTLDPK